MTQEILIKANELDYSIRAKARVLEDFEDASKGIRDCTLCIHSNCIGGGVEYKLSLEEIIAIYRLRLHEVLELQKEFEGLKCI